jgi:hypothetical protein
LFQDWICFESPQQTQKIREEGKSHYASILLYNNGIQLT